MQTGLVPHDFINVSICAVKAPAAHLETTVQVNYGPYHSCRAKVRALDLSGELGAATDLCMSGPDNFRAMALANRFSRDAAFAGNAVYVLGPSDMGIMKIGYAADPLARQYSLQIGNWHNLSVHALVWFDCAAGRVERSALAAAKEMGLRLRGEWVEASPQEATELVLKAARFNKMLTYDSAVWIENIASRATSVAVAKKTARRMAA